jgi:dihydrodipicolinate synthase/N-acetylneuraminate lyase
MVGISVLSGKHPTKVIFNGIDAYLPLGLAYGAHGGIGTTYNILPQLYLKIDQLARGGDLPAAVAATRQAMAANSGYKAASGGKQIQAIKRLLMWQGLLQSDAMIQADHLAGEDATRLRQAVLREPTIAPTLRDAWKEMVGLD